MSRKSQNEWIKCRITKDQKDLLVMISKFRNSTTGICSSDFLVNALADEVSKMDGLFGKRWRKGKAGAFPCEGDPE